MKKLHKSCIVFSLLLQCWVYADRDPNEARTPEFKVQVPQDHLFLVGIDRGEPGNRIFIDDTGSNQAPGVDPVTGNMMRLPSEVYVSLAYPHKRENPKLSSVMWTVYAGYRYSQEELTPASKISTNMELDIGYNFFVETKVQRIIYQHEGRVHNDYVRNIIETPVAPKLEEVETGIEGTKLYQIPFGEVDGVTRFIVILVSDSFDNARNVLKISDRNPKFKWNTDWFNKTPTQN